MCVVDMLSEEVGYNRIAGSVLVAIVAGSLWCGGVFVTISFYYQFASRTNGPCALFIPRPLFWRGRSAVPLGSLESSYPSGGLTQGYDGSTWFLAKAPASAFL